MIKDKSSSIVLIGFMASGKSTIGAKLAEMMGYALLDIDAMIEAEHGKTIASIFMDDGEEAFRKAESKIIADVAGRAQAVVVTGGGAPLRFDNRNALMGMGHIFFLDAGLTVILKRLESSEHRPLIAKKGQDGMAELFRYRYPIYRALGHAIDANRGPDPICQDIITRYRAMESLSAQPAMRVMDGRNGYPIYHFFGAVDRIGEVIDASGLRDHRPVIITSDKLVEMFRPKLTAVRDALGGASCVIIDDGERHKNFVNVHKIHEQMFDLGLTRKSLAIAIGGGNVGDVAGFAAAIFLRGIPILQVPTTLLSMVDASIGGKTGIDCGFGKNLIGAFHDPCAVIIDPDFLASLPEDDLSSGMAEVIKHAMIGDRSFFYELLRGGMAVEHLITRALLIKKDIVESDPRESGERAWLNLGHTFAHGLERESDYRIRHGHAVAIGLVLATSLSKHLGFLAEDFEKDLLTLLKKFHLPTDVPSSISRKKLVAAMSHDKKRDDKGLRLVLPRRLGEVFIHHIDERALLSWMEAI